MYKPKSKQFFIDNIWKTIYRDKWTCNCKTCRDVELNGLIVHDENHASYLSMIDSDFASEWFYSNYRITKVI